MNISHLEVFCHVVEDGGVTKAAEALVMTQPAVSLTIQKLERSLGVKLFERRSTSMVPTPAGEILYRYANGIRDLYQGAHTSLNQYRHGFHGRIILGVATGVLYMLPTFLRRYRSAVPGVELTLRSDNSDRVREEVGRGMMDLGLVWGPVADERIDAEPIARTEFFVIVPSDHELADVEEVTPAVLSRFPFVLGAEGTSTRSFIEAKLRDAGIVPKVTAGMSTTEAMKRAVEGHIGLGVLSRDAVHYEIEAGVLRPLRVKGFAITREVSMVLSKKARTSAVMRFVHAVRSHPPFLSNP